MEISVEKKAQLEQSARDAARHSYSPYSGFPVGAAVLTGSGAIYAGCNVENVSLGLTLCAERNAVARAIGAGERRITAVAVYTPTPTPTPPCGACRQVLAEFAAEAVVICLCAGSTRRETTLKALLPEAFAANGDHGKQEDEETHG